MDKLYSNSTLASSKSLKTPYEIIPGLPDPSAAYPDRAPEYRAS